MTKCSFLKSWKLSQQLYYCSCGRPSPSPACVPRDVSTNCRPGAVCVEAIFLVFMASAMTSHHYLTSHSENPNPLEYSFRVLHILTINMLNKIEECGVTQRRLRQSKACSHAEHVAPLFVGHGSKLGQWAWLKPPRRNYECLGTCWVPNHFLDQCWFFPLDLSSITPIMSMNWIQTAAFLSNIMISANRFVAIEFTLSK